MITRLTPTFLVEKFGFRLTNAGLSGAVFIHLASAAVVPLAGLWADRLTRRFVGGTKSIATLLVAMTCFGLCKGLYDSGIFASLFDAVEPRARGTAAGLMNTVGWGGGALGPLFVGLASRYGGQPSEVENMSDAIAFGGAVYLVAAAFVGAAILVSARRQPGIAQP